MRQSSLPLTATAFAALAVIFSLILTALRGAPYLDLGDALNPWLAVYAICLLGFSCLIPVALNDAITLYRPDRAESREPAMIAWGGIAAIGSLAGFLIASAGGWSTADSLAAAAGLILLIESLPILLGVLFWMLAG